MWARSTLVLGGLSRGREAAVRFFRVAQKRSASAHRLTGLLWGGAVRIFLLHHATFSINSLCGFFGRRPFATGMSHGTWDGPRRSRSARHGTTTIAPSRPPPRLGPTRTRPGCVADHHVGTMPAGVEASAHHITTTNKPAHHRRAVGDQDSDQREFRLGAPRLTHQDPRTGPVAGSAIGTNFG